MPFLSFRVSTDVSQDRSDRVAHVLTELTTIILGKKRELVSVEVGAVPPRHWYIGGENPGLRSLATFYLDIKVTEGTNTRNEKAEYVRQVFDAVAGIFGPLASASYVVIHEVRADGWGYGGQTQEYRYVHGKSGSMQAL